MLARYQSNPLESSACSTRNTRSNMLQFRALQEIEEDRKREEKSTRDLRQRKESKCVATAMAPLGP